MRHTHANRRFRLSLWRSARWAALIGLTSTAIWLLSGVAAADEPPASALRSPRSNPSAETAVVPTVETPAVWVADASQFPQPLCALSADASERTHSLAGRIGAAVVDIRTGETWSGGGGGQTFTLHSVSKAVLAFAALTQIADDAAQSHADDPEAEQEEVPEPYLDSDMSFQIWHMIVMGENWAAKNVVNWLGGTEAMAQFYRRVGAEQMAQGVHDTSWGLGVGLVHEVAHFFAQAAGSESVPEWARERAYSFLTLTTPAVVWHHLTAPWLPGWHAATKTGWYYLANHVERINHASIIFDRDGEARYSIVVMYEGVDWFDNIWGGINGVHRSVAAQIALREQGEPYGDSACQAASGDTARWLSELEHQISLTGPAPRPAHLAASGPPNLMAVLGS